MQKQPLSSHYRWKRASPKTRRPPRNRRIKFRGTTFRRTTEFLLVRALAYYETVEFYENETREFS